jgi:hypothetical protein
MTASLQRTGRINNHSTRVLGTSMRLKKEGVTLQKSGCDFAVRLPRCSTVLTTAICAPPRTVPEPTGRHARSFRRASRQVNVTFCYLYWSWLMRRAAGLRGRQASEAALVMQIGVLCVPPIRNS